MLLASFMCKSAFANKAAIVDCCDNCIYNPVAPDGVPHYQLHDVTSTLSTRYKKTTQFAELSLSAERTRLLAASRNRIARTLGEIVLAYEKRLNEFATQMWPTNGMDEIKFSVL